MSFITKFKPGDRVRKVGVRGISFTVAQIRIQTLIPYGSGSLIEYRPVYTTGRSGPWVAERYLFLAAV